jgi:hypothetical protein
MEWIRHKFDFFQDNNFIVIVHVCITKIFIELFLAKRTFKKVLLFLMALKEFPVYEKYWLL